MYTLGINFSHHTSVALLKNNEVLFFCLEERFNRIKEYGGNTIPANCLDKIKQFTNVVDLVVGVSGSNESLQKSVQRLRSSGVAVSRATIKNTAHHLYHAAAAFYLSQFDSATCMVIDGAGCIYKFNSSIRASETTSFYEVDYTTGFRCTHKNFTAGIYDGGGLKGIVDTYPETKTTTIRITEEEVKVFNKMFNNIDNIVTSTSLDTGIKYHCAAAKIGRTLGWKGSNPDGKMMGLSGYGYTESSTAEEQLAYYAQKDLENDFINKMKYVKQTNLVIGGGCALNILGNSLIKKKYPHINIFVDPVAHDGTLSLGAAAYNFYNITKCKQKLTCSPYAGLDYLVSKKDLYECVRKYSV